MIIYEIENESSGELRYIISDLPYYEVETLLAEGEAIATTCDWVTIFGTDNVHVVIANK